MTPEESATAAPYYADDNVTVHHGKSQHVLPTLPDASVDAVVCDPPYELGFMGRAWDASGIAYNVDLWREVLRVLKPGGHLLAFGGTRTVHRMTCAIEDAGFEIRDGIDWIYASGFPKSLDVSKALDKARRRDYVLAAVGLGLNIPGNNLHDWTKAEHSPGDAWWEKFKAHVPAADWQRIERKVIGERTTGRGTGHGAVAYIGDSQNRDITAPATDAAREWQGWGTALKPAREPIIVARSPLTGTVAANVLEHGTGALNIDACRVGGQERVNYDLATATRTQGSAYGAPSPSAAFDASKGRWPTNIVFSHSPDCGTTCTSGCPADSSEARFFPVFRFEAKAPTSERPIVDGVAHETVKPLNLMRWLVRLVTQPGGLVLDPFAGSGTTAEACVIEGFRCIAIEQDARYLPLIASRLARRMQ